MIDAFEKFINFISGSFWDWQFFVFVFCAVLIFCFSILNREKPFGKNPVADFVYENTGKSDRVNYLIIFAANVFFIAAAVSIAGIPAPQTHDEFAYLLAADTFLHGRIVNPTPVSPAHFEYFHILLTPVYAAKYPPLQGFFLAAGKLLTGFPIAGVWLTSLLSGLAIYWLLRAFFSLRWALFGAFLWLTAPLNFVWLDSYWGAHVAVIGGALSIGACFRYLQKRGSKNLFIWGLGIFLLLNSRIYEGTVLTAILVLIWIFETLKNKQIGNYSYRGFAVFALIIFVNFAAIAFYNFQITKNPLVLPYSLHHSQHHQVPLFIFQKTGESKPGIPPVIKKLDERWTAEFKGDYKTPSAAVISTVERIPVYLVWLTRSPFLLALFLLGLYGLAKGAEENFGWKILVIFLLFLTALFLTVFKGDRFISPVAGLAFVSITLAAKMLYRRNGFWKPAVLLLPLVIGGGFILGLISVELKRVSPPNVENNFVSRVQITDYLKAQGGKHLIFVETNEANPADARFYVYNDAEIRDSPIVWAHNLSESENRVLIENYQNRKIWQLEIIEYQAVLTEYKFLK